MDTAPKIVLQNPYRILGVYANSAKKDIVANKGKATAFVRVGKPVEFPLDLKGILPVLNRTLDLMNEAEAHLAIAKEQIKYAQFWFLKMNPIDDVAFNHLVAGNLTQAKEIWSKQESLSSLQNKLVCYLIEDKPWLALKIAEKLYEKFGESYINKVDANCTLQMLGTELLHQFIDSLGEEVGMQELLGYESGAETKAYIRSQTVGPLISKISTEVEKAKKVDRKDPISRKNAGQKLMVVTKEPLQQLKGVLKVGDSQYQMIADKLGLAILQCGIDYFNNSEDDDAPLTAMKLQKYALSIVVGTLAKQRCEENVKTLQKIIDELPPKEVITEDKAIKAELSKFVRLPDKISHAITLLNNTKPHLQSIKRKLGSTSEYYLKKSTQIVGNALHNVVEEVNEVQQGNVVELDNGVKVDLDVLMTPDDRRAKYNRIKSTVREAWKATTLMDEFDMEAGFKSHFNENRNTLKSMCNQMGISTYVSRPSTSSRPISKSSTSASSTRSTTQSRPSTAYSSSTSSSSSSNEDYGCLLWVIAALVAGAVGAALTQSGVGFFVGVAIVGSIWGKTQ